jgi:hypothetical protein
MFTILLPFFVKKKIRARDYLKKKLSTQAKNFEKIIVQVGNVPPPPSLV